MKTIKIGVLVGSLRRESYSKKIAQAVCELMPDGFEVKYIDISDLSIFNQDFDDDGTTPQQWARFRSDIKAVDALLFFTPEYNRSLPPVLKNALDIASRPYGQNVWAQKPGAVVGVSIGGIGGFGAAHHLRQVMSFLDVYMMQQPEMYIGNVAALLGDDGKIKDEKTTAFLQSFVDAFVNWVNKFNL